MFSLIKCSQEKKKEVLWEVRKKQEFDTLAEMWETHNVSTYYVPDTVIGVLI